MAVNVAKSALVVLFAGSLLATLVAQQPKPTFEVVSIKLATQQAGRPAFASAIIERPDGGFTTIQPARTLIIRAYPGINVVGLPGWATSDLYNISATSSLSAATADDRAAMLRALLADRFKLTAHVEKREEPAFDLVLARSDGRLGPGIKPTNVDCARLAAERAAAPLQPQNQRPDLKAPPPTCTMRTIGAMIRDIDGDKQGRLGDLLEGEGTMDHLAQALVFGASRPIVNKTGLSGSYQVRMNYDMRSGRVGPTSTTGAADPTGIASIFTAVQEQLGLKLESSRKTTDTLVIDHLERPTPN